MDDKPKDEPPAYQLRLRGLPIAGQTEGGWVAGGDPVAMSFITDDGEWRWIELSNSYVGHASKPTP